MIPYQSPSTLQDAAVQAVRIARSWRDAAAMIRSTPGYSTAAGAVKSAAMALANQLWTQPATKRKGKKKGSRSMPPIGGVLSPVSYGYRVRSGRPKFKAMSGGVRIKHREYISDVWGHVSSNALPFAVTSIQCNPGVSDGFPWLASIANNFEKYRFISLAYQYVNVTGTDQPGRVTLAYEKDPLDPLPSTKGEMFSYVDSVDGAIWDKLKLPVGSSSQLFTRNSLIEGSDLKTYDAGKLILSIGNTTASQVVGELFVEYEVELHTPQPSECQSTHYSVGAADTTFGTTTPFGQGGTPEIAGFGNWYMSGGDKIVFTTPGHYLIVATWAYTGSASGISFDTDDSTALISMSYLEETRRLTAPGQIEWSMAVQVRASQDYVKMASTHATQESVQLVISETNASVFGTAAAPTVSDYPEDFECALKIPNPLRKPIGG